MTDELFKKEDRIESQKVGQEIMGLHEIIKKIQGQVSYAQHKIEKTIILEEKAERESGKKEKEMLKRI